MTHATDPTLIERAADGVRTDTFDVGDVVEWNIPVVMQFCRTWAPDITKPTTIIAVRSAGNENLQRAAGHTQLVRVSPNYCPFDDEFAGKWFKPRARTTDQNGDRHD